MATIENDEILTVHKVARDADGTLCVECPHCKRIVGLEPGPIRGEQFQHGGKFGCDGWFEIDHEVKLYRSDLQ